MASPHMTLCAFEIGMTPARPDPSNEAQNFLNFIAGYIVGIYLVRSWQSIWYEIHPVAWLQLVQCECLTRMRYNIAEFANTASRHHAAIPHQQRYLDIFCCCCCSCCFYPGVVVTGCVVGCPRITKRANKIHATIIITLIINAIDQVRHSSIILYPYAVYCHANARPDMGKRRMKQCGYGSIKLHSIGTKHIVLCK